MSTLALRLCLATLLAGTALAARAGTVEVSFDPTAVYADAGSGQGERERNLDELATHLKGLGERLSGNRQLLKVQLLDLDLAGTVRVVGRSGTELRIVRGGADWPRIRLSYTLSEDGRELRRGEEWISDLAYTTRSPAYGSRAGDALYAEKRLLDDWFTARFGAAREAAH